jgi:hypothetical protein
MKIRPMGAQLFHADRQTEGRMDGWTDRHDEANNSVSQFFESGHKWSIKKIS